MGILDFFTKKTNTVSPNALVPVIPDQIYESALLELRDKLAPSALEISPRNLTLGDRITRTYFTIGYPSYLDAGWLSPTVNASYVFDLCLHIHPIDTTSIMQDLRKKSAEAQSQLIAKQQSGEVRDPSLDAAVQNIEQLREALQRSQTRMFTVGLYLTLYADDMQQLQRIELDMLKEIEKATVYMKPAMYQQNQGFHSTSPIGKDELGISTQLDTYPLSTTFPFISSELSDDKGILYGINRYSAGLVIFDRYSLPNYNSVLIATSGAGKSFAVKLEILRTMMFDTEVIVIDPEREYEFLAEAVGGRYFNISLSSDNHINPFDLPDVLPDEDPQDVLRGNIIHLVGLFRVMFGGLSPEEDAIVDKAINETYALKDITAASDFSKIEAPLMSDFEMVLSSIEGSDSLLQRLTKYTTGTWAGFINKPTNVDINKKLVVFSIRDMEDDLKPAAMYMITHYIWNAVRRQIKKRLLVVDEAWVMLGNDDAASFLFGIAKRGRKYFLGLATITQDVNDYLKSKYGEPILTNTSMQLLLKQSPATIDKLGDTFHLTDAEKQSLLSAEKGEGIFFAGQQHVAIKVEASQTEYTLVSSDPKEILAIKAAKAVLSKKQSGGFVN
jgi:conjugal transfer ATP-binding protein TraC